MSLQTWIIKLNKRKIISEEPHPAIPFVLFLIILALLIQAIIIGAGFIFILSIILLAAIALIFAVLHLIVFLILRKSRK